jgi:hypothetical protein
LGMAVYEYVPALRQTANTLAEKLTREINTKS